MMLCRKSARIISGNERLVLRRRCNLDVPLPHGIGPLVPESGKTTAFFVQRPGRILRAYLALVDRVDLEQLLLAFALGGWDWTFAIPVNDCRPDHVAHIGVAPIDDVAPGVCGLLLYGCRIGRATRQP